MIRLSAALVALAVPAFAATAPTSPAGAEKPPRTQPARDVDVTYNTGGDSKTVGQRSRWNVASGMQRVDFNGRHTYIVQRASPVTTYVVNDDTRQVTEPTTVAGPLNGGKASFKRLGTMTIAGLGCTEWDVTPDPSTHTPGYQICLTDDGVLLNSRIGDEQKARAISVKYGPVDPSIFAIPAGYAKPPATKP